MKIYLKTFPIHILNIGLSRNNSGIDNNEDERVIIHKIRKNPESLEDVNNPSIRVQLAAIDVAIYQNKPELIDRWISEGVISKEIYSFPGYDYILGHADDSDENNGSRGGDKTFKEKAAKAYAQAKMLMDIKTVMRSPDQLDFIPKPQPAVISAAVETAIRYHRTDLLRKWLKARKFSPELLYRKGYYHTLEDLKGSL